MTKLSGNSNFALRFVFFALVLALMGCSTHYGAAQIQSQPSGVQVFDMEDGTYIGVTPVRHVWKSSDAPRKFMNIRLHKQGFEDLVSTFWLNLGYSSAKKAASNPQPIQLELKKLE